MPRPLVYGNGRLLIAFDDRHRGRDLFWPNVGYPNHLLGHMMRVGVWCEGDFSWCDSDDWTRELKYENDSPVGHSLWRSWRLGLEIRIRECIHPEEAVFVRRLELSDLRGASRDAKVFFSQNFILGQSDVGNTAFYNPFCDAVIHYRGRFLVGCTVNGGDAGLDQYATGIKGFAGMEGTWKDAEDGELSGNPIAQGSVDSTVRATASLSALGSAVIEFTLALSDRLDTVSSLISRFRTNGFEEIRSLSNLESSGWLEAIAIDGLERLSPEVQRLFYRSLLIMRTQIDHEGAILAANDADILETNRATYSYCWPRDGALVASLFSHVGQKDIADQFLGFCARVMQEGQSFLMQKYRSDSSLGASWHPWVVNGRPMVPFQEDETALSLMAIEACETDRARHHWSTVGRQWADFLLEHRDSDGRPLESWDLWEERLGVHFFTTCAVIAGLSSAARLAQRAQDDYRHYEEASRSMRKSLSDWFFDDQAGRFCRMVGDCTPDSAVIGGMLLLNDWSQEEWLRETEGLAAKLQVTSAAGGFSRYSGDYYFRMNDLVPGNPWIISTMWFARAYLHCSRPDRAIALLNVVLGWAAPSGVLPEQVHPLTSEPLSVSPLTWSHAEVVETVLALAMRLSPSGR